MASARLGVLAVAAVLALVVVFATTTGSAWTSPKSPNSECSGVQIRPGADLAKIAASHSPGTTYCIYDGDYSVSSPIQVEDGDVFKGSYSDTTRPSISTTKASHVFRTTGADNAMIEGVDISGAVHENACEPNCGRGIGGGGNNLIVRNVRAHHNENQGIGGTGNNLRVYDSEFDHNGNHDSAKDGGKVSAAGIKSVNSMYIYNSYFHDNYWTGVWCDLECNTLEVHDSTLERNGKAGIHYEISTGPSVFEGNTIKGNGHITGYDTRHAGILIVGSSNVDVYGNALSDNNGIAMLVAADGRTGGTVSSVNIHDNTLGGDILAGCSISDVTCRINS